MKEDKAKLFVKKSECSVKTCAHFLKEVLKKRKIPIFAVYDHGKTQKQLVWKCPKRLLVYLVIPA